jgi:ABC-type transporter Mla subunit MlaD
VAGIGWALTIKIRLALFGEAPICAKGSAGQATVGDLVTQLVRLNSSVAGDPNSSVLAALKDARQDGHLARQQNNDRLDRLCEALQTYTERSAETNSRVLVKALADVVLDFNNKLNEQFGENFKQLNVAVGKMVTWQTQYEQQLNRLLEQETQTREAMAAASRHYSDLVDKSTVFVTTAQSLGQMLGALDAERESLASALTILAGLIENASRGLPQIEKSIVEMTEQIARGVQTNQETMGSVLKSSWQSVQAHNQYLAGMLAKSLETANRDLADHARRVDLALKKQAIA